MRVLVLTSGGDAPGMNAVLHHLTKFLTRRGHSVFASKHGFQGLLDDNIIALNTALTKPHMFFAGAFIKSSRCLEFKKKKGQDRAVETLKKHNIDLVIIIGGDGSYQGAISLAKLNQKVIFLPATIDRDLQYDTYSTGFYTAAEACAYYISKVKMTMQAFDRICIYEIMGRDNPSLTNLVAKKVNADLVITKETKNKLDLDAFAKAHAKNPVQTVVLQERLFPISYVENLLEEKTGGGIRSCVIGYFQRGKEPTRQELSMAKLFAKQAVNNIKNKNFNVAVAIKNREVLNHKLV